MDQFILIQAHFVKVMFHFTTGIKNLNQNDSPWNTTWEIDVGTQLVTFHYKLILVLFKNIYIFLLIL